jgi:hypothetical protein
MQLQWLLMNVTKYVLNSLYFNCIWPHLLRIIIIIITV